LTREDLTAAPEWWAHAQAARLLLIKWALGLTDGHKLQFSAPYRLVEDTSEVLESPIDPTLFTPLLDSQGLLSSVIPFASPSSEATNLSLAVDEAVARAINAITSDRVPEEQDFYEWLHVSPDDAYEYLAHLKPTNNEQSFLAKILTTGRDALEMYGWSIPKLAMNQFQYALRYLEQIGHAGENGVDRIGGTWEELERTLQLLIVYLDKVLDEGVLPIESILFDLRGISTQYIFLEWVRETYTPWLEGRLIESSYAMDRPTGIGG
jgi:hypothetical protein